MKSTDIKICKKCGAMYDHYQNYPEISYEIPKYGKPIKGYCHNCKPMRGKYKPMKNGRVAVVLKDLYNNGFVSNDDYKIYHFTCRRQMMTAMSYTVNLGIIKQKNE